MHFTGKIGRQMLNPPSVDLCMTGASCLSWIKINKLDIKIRKEFSQFDIHVVIKYPKKYILRKTTFLEGVLFV